MTFLDAFIQVLASVFAPQMIALYTMIFGIFVLGFFLYVLFIDWPAWVKALCFAEIGLDIMIIISLVVWVNSAPSATSWVAS